MGGSNGMPIATDEGACLCMQEVQRLNLLGGKILYSPRPLEETINQGTNTPFHMMNTLIYEESKDPVIPQKGVL